MSSKSIYTFDKTNKSLSDLFSIRYSPISYEESLDWSNLERISQPKHGFFTSNRRERLIQESKDLMKGNVPYSEKLLRTINVEIGYLLNRYHDTKDSSMMTEIRALRKAKNTILKKMA